METVVLTQSNIIDPRNVIKQTTTARHSSEIVENLLIADGFEVLLYKNSILQEKPFDLEVGDVVNVIFVPQGGGGGKNILGLVATIALAVVAVPLAGQALGALAGTGVLGAGALGGFSGGLALYGLAGGIMIAGSLLINAVFGSTATSSLNSDSLSNSTTYSWSEAYNKTDQGLPIPKVFGTHKITPPLISKYIESIDDSQYFNGLYALNDGEITDISNIQINGESIDNFDNIDIYIRNGSLYQTNIPTFDHTISDKSVGKKISTDYITTQTDGNEVVELSVTLLFPNGLYYIDDKGNIQNNTVKMILQYSNDNINWNNFVSDDQSPVYWYRLDSDYGEYYRSTSLDGTYEYYGHTLPSGAIRYYNGSFYYKYNEYYYTNSYTLPYFTITDATTSTIRKTFKVSYLNNGSYYIRAKFYEEPKTGNRYGSSCYLEYISESVGYAFTYPKTALLAIRALATDQLSGSQPIISCNVTANSNNPALICKQILTESGIESDRFLDSFDDFETHCDTMGYTFDGVFDASVTVRKALDLVALCGRASVIQFGSKYGVVMDRAEEIPVQSFTFGMGNILKDSFKQTFLTIKDRANVIEATYYDKELDYDKTIIEVSNDNYDSVAEENKTSITLIGFTDRAKAISYCRYQLNCNRYLTETLSIQADKDSLVCKYGDIVRVSHDLPLYGFSGRITACDTTTVTLDREVTLEAGKSYYVVLRDNENNVKEHYVNNTEETTYTLTFTTPLTDAYDKYDNFQFGEVGKAYKLYRVLKISTTNEFLRTLSLIEYNENVYVDGADIEVPIVSSLGLSNLRATDYIRYASNGSIETVMSLAWSGKYLNYIVKYKKASDTAYTSTIVYTNKLDLVVNEGDYNIIVSSNGESISLDYTVLGKLAKPDAVENITYTEQSDNFLIAWEYTNKPIDFSKYRIYRNNTLIGETTSLSYLVPIIEKTSVISIRAVDTSGFESTYTNFNITCSYMNDLSNVNTIYQNNELIAFWDDASDTIRTASYQIKKGTSWTNAQNIDITSNKKETLYTNGTYLFKAIYTTTSGFIVESENSYSLVVDESILSKNVLEEYSEFDTNWSGTLTNCIVTDSGYLTLSGDKTVDEYENIDGLTSFDYGNKIIASCSYEIPSSHIISLSTAKLCKIYTDLDIGGMSIISTVDSWASIDALSSIDGYLSSDFDVKVQIAISQDGVNYGDWSNFINGEYIGQSFKFRLVIMSYNDFVTPIIREFKFTVDMPDIFESGSDTSGTTAKTITYLNSFSVPPKVQITILNAIAGDDATLTNETENSFDIIINNSGSAVARNFNYFVKGY